MNKLKGLIAACVLGLIGTVSHIEYNFTPPLPLNNNYSDYSRYLEEVQNSCVLISIPLGEPLFVGTGFPIHKDKDWVYILTAHHVTILPAAKLQIKGLPSFDMPQPFVSVVKIHKTHQEIDGSYKGVPGQVIYSWPKPADMALIRVSKREYNPERLFPIQDKILPSLGDPTISVASPKGQAGVLSCGIIISNFKTDGFSYINSTNMSIPGASGGPLIDRQGKVCGLVQRGMGESFAVSLSGKDIRRLLDKAGFKHLGAD
jgi:S1-C subfamily serine protease